MFDPVSRLYNDNTFSLYLKRLSATAKRVGFVKEYDNSRFGVLILTANV